MARNKAIFDKQEIIDVAFEIIRREGIEAFTARRLAKELGVSPMTIYNYVKNIYEIKKEVLIKGFNILYKLVFEEIKKKEKELQTEGLINVCEIMAIKMMEFALSYKGIYLLMFTSEGTELRNDYELRPFYNFYSKLMYIIEVEECKIQDIKKAFYLFETIVNGIIVDKLSNRKKITTEEFVDYIKFSLKRLFADIVI